jgi:hypothetical protein
VPQRLAENDLLRLKVGWVGDGGSCAAAQTAWSLPDERQLAALLAQLDRPMILHLRNGRGRGGRHLARLQGGSWSCSSAARPWDCRRGLQRYWSRVHLCSGGRCFGRTRLRRDPGDGRGRLARHRPMRRERGLGRPGLGYSIVNWKHGEAVSAALWSLPDGIAGPKTDCDRKLRTPGPRLAGNQRKPRYVIHSRWQKSKRSAGGAKPPAAEQAVLARTASECLASSSDAGATARQGRARLVASPAQSRPRGFAAVASGPGQASLTPRSPAGRSE